jgi:hypothetical protein
MTFIATSTNFQAWTNEAAVACRKISSEMTLACDNSGVTYSPIYHQIPWIFNTVSYSLHHLLLGRRKIGGPEQEVERPLLPFLRPSEMLPGHAK